MNREALRKMEQSMCLNMAIENDSNILGIFVASQTLNPTWHRDAIERRQDAILAINLVDLLVKTKGFAKGARLTYMAVIPVLCLSSPKRHPLVYSCARMVRP